MNSFMTFIQEKLTPIANFFGAQRHFSAMQKGFMATVSFILVSAIFMIIANPPVTADLIAQGGFWSIFEGWYNFSQTYKATILIPFNMTMGMLSLISAFAIAYYLAGSYKLSQMNAGFTSMIIFMIVAAPANYVALADGNVASMINTTYLGSQGLFTSIIVSLLTVEITRICMQKKITIKMPEGVPPFLSDMFSSIVPLVINVTLFFSVNLLISNFIPGSSLPSLIETILAKPVSAVNSIPGAILVSVLILVMWCCGVHGMMVFMPLTTPITMAAFAANAELFAAGQAPIFHPIFMTQAIALLGGTGNTLALVILCLKKAKSKQLSVFGKASIVPAIFRISEPVIFGAPIMFNPILMIPFVLSGTVIAIFYWLACAFGLITPFYILVTGTFPIIINSFIKCLDWRMIVFEIVALIVTIFIWYPFFKVYDNQLLTQEKENAQNIEPVGE